METAEFNQDGTNVNDGLLKGPTSSARSEKSGSSGPIESIVSERPKTGKKDVYVSDPLKIQTNHSTVSHMTEARNRDSNPMRISVSSVQELLGKDNQNRV